jgi:hypothetical protein
MAAMWFKRQHLAIALLFLASACAQPGPERVVERRETQAPAARGEALLRGAVIDSHNVARAAVGTPPIAWSDALAVSARAYAEEMARTGRFEHAHQPMGPGRQGENLWTGTRDAYDYAEMMGHWLAERKDFVNLPVPAASRTGTFGDVGHYTQIVWRGSTEVGCALASNARDDYLVCRYSPPGNVVGWRAY